MKDSLFRHVHAAWFMVQLRVASTTLQTAASFCSHCCVWQVVGGGPGHAQGSAGSLTQRAPLPTHLCTPQDDGARHRLWVQHTVKGRHYGYKTRVGAAFDLGRIANLLADYVDYQVGWWGRLGWAGLAVGGCAAGWVGEWVRMRSSC